jgi:glycosyltransferase involved in cell wall biosynthesis
MPILLLFLLLFLPLPAEEKKKICLNMIVKDEKPVITRCLASVKPIIDYWVIVDTGSTDGTQEVIKEFMKDIPGELHERPWKNFEHNRNEALALAKDKADYLLIMDADDRLEYEPDFRIPSLTAGSYRLWIQYGDTSYQRNQIIQSSLPWKWVGVLHEVLTCDASHIEQMMDGVKYVVSCDGSRSRNPNKFSKDAEILEQALQNEPNNTRYMFYLAQSYRDGGQYDKALEWYRKRIEKGGWAEEVFFSMLQVALIERTLGRSEETVIDSLLRAHRYRPHRAEPVYYLAEIYRSQGRHDLCYTLIKSRDFIHRPPSKDVLFTQDWMDDYGLLFELSISAFYIGRFQESIDVCDTLLEIKDLPKEIRDQTELNRLYPMTELNKQARLREKLLDHVELISQNP